MRPVRVAVTPGDPLGVGPEVGLAAALACAAEGVVEPVLVGDEALWRHAADQLGLTLDGVELLPSDPEADERFTHIPEITALATAVRACQRGAVSAVCTMPIHKASLLGRGFHHPGHTGYLAELCGLDPDEAVMCFAGGQLAVSLATVHLPLGRVPELLDERAVARATEALVAMLRVGWQLPQPRIGVCGLNPHAGEDGELGSEDAEVIAPAVRFLRDAGLRVEGPLPADTLFHRAVAGDFDGVVAMYHDQGLAPVKTLDFGRSVNITWGLPVVRTSVDHGTARDIAGRGMASPRHAVAALKMAARLAGRYLPG